MKLTVTYPATIVTFVSPYTEEIDKWKETMSYLAASQKYPVFWYVTNDENVQLDSGRFHNA